MPSTKSTTRPWNVDMGQLPADETLYTDYMDQDKYEPCNAKFKTNRSEKWIQYLRDVLGMECVVSEEKTTVTKHGRSRPTTVLTFYTNGTALIQRKEWEQWCTKYFVQCKNAINGSPRKPNWITKHIVTPIRERLGVSKPRSRSSSYTSLQSFGSALSGSFGHGSGHSGDDDGDLIEGLEVDISDLEGDVTGMTEEVSSIPDTEKDASGSGTHGEVTEETATVSGTMDIEHDTEVEALSSTVDTKDGTGAQLEDPADEMASLRSQVTFAEHRVRQQELLLKHTRELVEQLQLKITAMDELAHGRDEMIHSLQAEIATNNERDNPCDNDKLFFRGWRNPLSMFYPCTLTDDNGGIFKSAEHYYQHTKLCSHNLGDEAAKIIKDKHAGKVKAQADRLIKEPSEGWIGNRVDVLYNICVKKATFKMALMATETKELLHNIEIDNFWGIGNDGKGENVMGTTLMKLGGHILLNSGDFDPPPPLPQDKTLVVTDSMLRDITEYFPNTDNAITLCFPGETTASIGSKIGKVLSEHKLDILIVHTGTNDVGNNEKKERIESSFKGAN